MIFKSRRQLGWAVAITVTAVLVINTYLHDKDSDTNTVVSARGTGSDNRRHHRPHTEMPALMDLTKIQKIRSGETDEKLFSSKSWYTPPPPPPPAPPPAPMAPPLPFSYLGKVNEADGSQTLFISDQTRVFLVHGGETLDQNYHVDGIKDGRLVITYLPLKQKQYLNLVEAK